MLEQTAITIAAVFAGNVLTIVALIGLYCWGMQGVDKAASLIDEARE